MMEGRVDLLRGRGAPQKCEMGEGRQVLTGQGLLALWKLRSLRHRPPPFPKVTLSEPTLRSQRKVG